MIICDILTGIGPCQCFLNSKNDFTTETNAGFSVVEGSRNRFSFCYIACPCNAFVSLVLAITVTYPCSLHTGLLHQLEHNH